MKDYLAVIKATTLFEGIGESELGSLLTCLSPRTAEYKKEQIIFWRSEGIESIGIVLSGQVQVIQYDYYGNRIILANLERGDLFGESFAYAETKSLPVSVVASADSVLLFIDCHRLAELCTKACACHNRLIQNMLKIVSLKNISLMQRIEFTSKRTTREKLLAYLSAEAQKTGSNSFRIPFNRQELADYLSVNRSAMSLELSRLRKDGLLNFCKNKFELLQSNRLNTEAH